MKLFTVISLASTLQALKNQEPKEEKLCYEKKPFSKKAHDEYYQLFNLAFTTMNLSNPATISHGTDGTCLLLYCEGCTKDIDFPLIMNSWLYSLEKECSKSMYKHQSGLVFNLEYSQKAECKNSASKVNKIRESYKLPPLKEPVSKH
ncbi:hypothetical protein DSO57_1030944 [Entomophthora muscae]|uniref:Uncharacterized protein n=1 Tax=Entomophthora muscae TaxID=34485 RepID=A0ACC2SQ03_9FUNG|nr:hypothetical protein DSO57_1030944 [Entomophthora muscae]